LSRKSLERYNVRRNWLKSQPSHSISIHTEEKQMLKRSKWGSWGYGGKNGLGVRGHGAKEWPRQRGCRDAGGALPMVVKIAPGRRKNAGNTPTEKTAREKEREEE